MAQKRNRKCTIPSYIIRGMKYCGLAYPLLTLKKEMDTFCYSALKCIFQVKIFKNSISCSAQLPCHFQMKNLFSYIFFYKPIFFTWVRSQFSVPIMTENKNLLSKIQLCMNFASKAQFSLIYYLDFTISRISKSKQAD